VSLPTLVRLDGSPLPPAQLDGKTLLIVNVASRCGLTPQYQALQALYQAHHEAGLVVVGVPCNQFAGQEPGSPDEIAAFCRTTYGVTFPLLEKQDVNGSQRSPLYRWLVDSQAGGGEDIEWNFAKFVVGPDGGVRARFAPTVAPDDPAVVAALGLS
jgi:glutathione peroxidase